MERDNPVPETDLPITSQMEDTMEPITEPITARPVSQTTLVNHCTHSRIIDDVLTRSGKRTGKVRCLECSAVIDDPHLERK